VVIIKDAVREACDYRVVLAFKVMSLHYSVDGNGVVLEPEGQELCEEILKGFFGGGVLELMDRSVEYADRRSTKRDERLWCIIGLVLPDVVGFEERRRLEGEWLIYCPVVDILCGDGDLEAEMTVSFRVVRWAKPVSIAGYLVTLWPSSQTPVSSLCAWHSQHLP
jgi:hypothetical protein